MYKDYTTVGMDKGFFDDEDEANRSLVGDGDKLKCGLCGRLYDSQWEEKDKRLTMQEMVTGLLSLIAGSSNPLLSIRALPFAFDLPMTEGVSEASVARELRVSRTTFNEEVRRIQIRCKVKNTRNGKTEQSREKYKEINTNDHWTNHTAERAARVAVCRADKGKANRKRAELRRRANDG
jgi:hypothetical protein